MDTILTDLDASRAAGTDAKSSHWKQHTEGFALAAQGLGIDGFGQLHDDSTISRTWNFLCQRLLHGAGVFASPQYGTMRELCRRQGRALTMDSLRHVYTHQLLDARVPDARTVCVIGDGMTHFAGPKLIEGRCKVVSVNLPEILMSDTILLKRAGFADDANAKVCRSRDGVVAALADQNIRLVMVPAADAGAVRDAGIDLFVNIASFQEMTAGIVADYFDIIRSNRSAWFYCCNREEKVLYGGERLVFDEYPWGEPEVHLREDCPWHQRYYSKRPPFVHRYDGNIKHALVRYG